MVLYYAKDGRVRTIILRLWKKKSVVYSIILLTLSDYFGSHCGLGVVLLKRNLFPFILFFFLEIDLTKFVYVWLKFSDHF